MPTGTLYIVATPIGNLEDITLRALRILKEVDLIAAEDTRHTRHLLDRHHIDNQLTSYHDHNKEEKAPVLVSRMLDGRSIALVTDAGTPGISDPGYFLINLAIDQKIPVVPIPGATAAIAALSISGMPTDSFVFEGFLPSKQMARAKRLQELAQEKRTLIFYEAPHKIIKTIEDMLEVLGDRRAVVTRELTKIHEEAIRGALSEILKHLSEGTIKGEFTIILHGASAEPQKQDIDTAEYLKNLMLHRGLSKKEAIAAAADELGLPKKEVYKESLKIDH
ncbi:MAG: 16S rRNA (cytidine(1402)-2'-O)-methyltransferase [Nitrospirae bacterium GWD2_57_9]|nr:MAG: 16S rRNA (cytidine(1402)-2'-O)-methyltransferase [Nitrospirae bacterium GWD2_57_9]OGW51107.1 MAG: 16S rRNA (cytidine(1402)-2'-O)-methyltransferase [Nitrospirae bacterium GWC2_57_9]